MPRYWKIFALIALVLVAASIGGQVALAKQPDGEAFVVMRPRDAKSQRPQPKTNLLASGGGAIQKTTTVYISFWGSEWQNGFVTGGYASSQAQTYVTGFFQNVGGTTWIGNDNQYCQGVIRGVTSCPATATFIQNPNEQFGGSWNDLAPVPARPTQSDIAAAALRLRTQFPTADDANATFMVFTPSGKSMSGFGTQWCGWHSSTSSAGAQIAYAYIPYLPDAGGSCGMNFVNKTNNSFGNGYFDGFSIVAGHEFEEAKSDPYPSSGWTDSTGAENADKCAWNSMSSNLVLNSASYAVQPLWSNVAKGCVDPTP